MPGGPFIELSPCPDCGGDVSVRFAEGRGFLVCASCGRIFGGANPAERARELCEWWNLIFMEADIAEIQDA